jgi:hypothetical protein
VRNNYKYTDIASNNVPFLLLEKRNVEADEENTQN